MLPEQRELFVFTILGMLTLPACSTSHPRTDPVGKTFPSVTGTSLDGTSTSIPEDFAGKPAVLLVGYKMESQFDCDRWILGLVDSGVEARVCEVPTIPGMMPGIFSGYIDNGMRSGIPEEDWPSVVTVYGDGDEIAKFLGNENELPARVVLLDAEGKVAFFHDRGYSVGTLKKLLEALRDLG